MREPATVYSSQFSKRTSREQLSPEIEGTLYDYVVVFRAHKIPPTCSVLHHRAFFSRIPTWQIPKINLAARKKLQNYTFSKNYIDKVSKRNDLCTLLLSNKADRFNLASVSFDIMSCQMILENHNVTFVFDVN